MEYIVKLISLVLRIYTMLIWIRIITSWMRLPPSGFTAFLERSVDPYLDRFKNIRWMRRGMLDFTPLAALVPIGVLKSLCDLYLAFGTVTAGMAAAVIVRTLYSYLAAPFLFFIIAVIAIRLVYCYRRSPRTLIVINSLNRVVTPFTDFVQSLFFGSRATSVRTIVWTSLIFYLAAYILSVMAVNQIALILFNL